MGAYIARRLVKMLIQADRPVKGARVGVLGLTFKENVPDLRNSRVPDVLAELASFGIDALVHDAWADAEEAVEEYGVRPSPWEELADLDALVLAVSHEQYTAMPVDELLSGVREGGVVVDVKSMLDPATVALRFNYWSL